MSVNEIKNVQHKTPKHNTMSITSFVSPLKKKNGCRSTKIKKGMAKVLEQNAHLPHARQELFVCGLDGEGLLHTHVSDRRKQAKP